MSFDLKYAVECIQPVIEKLPVTLLMTLVSTVAALIIGALFAVIRSKQIKVVSQIAAVLCSFLKGIPVLAMLYVLYYAMPSIMENIMVPIGFSYDMRNPPKMSFAIIAFSLSYVPYMCDMIQSAYSTIPKGQMEACMSIAMSKFQAMRRVILPQLVVVAIPNFGNHFVNILKMTSLAYMVTVVEMMGAAKNFAVMNQRFLETYIVAALVYWAVCILFEQLFKYIEKHTGKFRQTEVAEKKLKNAVPGPQLKKPVSFGCMLNKILGIK